MKKMIGIALVLVLALGIVTGCGKPAGGGNEGGSGAASPAEITSAKTIGDLAKYENNGYMYDDKNYVTVVVVNGDFYRAKAKLTKEILEKLDAVDFQDENTSQKVEEIMAPIEIAELLNLSDMVLPKEELDKLVGKTGEDLLNAGWTTTGYYPDGSSIRMDHGPAQYDVVFEETIPEAGDGTDTDEVIKPLKVKSIEFVEISSSAFDFDAER